MPSHRTSQGTPNRSERRPGTSPPDSLRASWNNLQVVNQEVAAAYRKWYEAQNFLYTNVEDQAKCLAVAERRCGEYYHEIKKLAAKNIALQEELSKANGLFYTADHRAKELDAISTHLANDLERALAKIREIEVSSCEMDADNLALKQKLYEADERIRTLESRVVGADPHSANASGSENKAHELDAIDPKSPDVIITELRAKLTAKEEEYDRMVKEYNSALANASERISVAENEGKQFKNKENCQDNRETDSPISVTSKRASPSLGDGGGQNAEDSKTKAEYGKRYRRGKARMKKLGRNKPGLEIVCG
jgi:hypothetical protein